MENDGLSWHRQIQLNTMLRELSVIAGLTVLLTDVQWAEIERIKPRLYLVADQVRQAADKESVDDRE